MLQIQDQSQRPLTTAHLAQTMSLLLLSNAELRDKVLSELADNPALELLDERICPNCHRKLKNPGPCPVCSQQQTKDEAIVFLSPRESLHPKRSATFEEDLSEQEPAAPEDLVTHVLNQLAAELLPEDRSLAIYILSSLDEDGFLQDPPVFIARTTRSSLTQIDRVLKLIARSEPRGLAATGPRHALLLQLETMQDVSPLARLAFEILQDCFEELGRREFEKIAALLETSSSQVREAAAFIHDNLNPYPGRAFWGSGRHPRETSPLVYHAPDIMISQSPNDEDGPLIVEIFASIRGWLRVNPLFSKLKASASGDQSEEWTKHLERASLFVKCLHQRNNTMRRMMETLVISQRDFILNGPRFLKPMTRAKLATKIGVHESTVSRAVANKSVALPDGRIIPLAKFFDRNLAVRDRIQEIVRNEIRPLTDEEIAERLRSDGVKIARRTVAKYRAIDGILPARLRHREGNRVPQ
jgi:RNA polymerase sigma-54 factor